MGGAALSRLWDTHPKLAFPLHVFSLGVIGWVTISVWAQGSSWVAVSILAFLFVFDVASLVLATIDAAQRGWTKSDGI
jgi:hypothetical protein